MVGSEDRDKLFGVIAVELGFVTEDDVAAAVRARGTGPGKSLGRVLVEHQALGGEEHALLEALVEKHLTRNGNDLQRSLAALRSVQIALRKADSPDSDSGRLHTEKTSGISDCDDAFPPTLAGPPDDKSTHIKPANADGWPEQAQSHPPRYRILRQHATGGLGRVFVAYDPELKREVALKEIHARYSHLADCRARFLLEAEVTGRLEHPGIVPVYGLGRHADGLPYYAMRFIQGESLKDAIQRFHASRIADNGRRALELRHLLGVFLSVCQAVRYAHSRGIVHRDLKPENVMLGKFGETLVVDWGLAKSVEASAEASQSDEKTPAEGPLTLEADGTPLVTRAGTILGTPGYMSPEQADGLLSEVGPASDVYSLGATLYTILTGQAPLTAKDLAGALEQGSKGTFPPPRAIDRNVPRALEAVCMKAMALLPRDRYSGVRELAEDVERWLAYEPVSAYREPLFVRAARVVRKYPARVAFLMAVALIGTAALLGLVFVVSASNRELGESNRRETAARRQADAGFREAQGAVNEFFTEISENKALLRKQPGMQALRRQLLEKARDYYEGFLRERGNDPSVRAEAAAAQYRLGEITSSLSPGSPDAIAYYERGLELLKPLLRANPDDPDHRLLQAKLLWGAGMALGRADRFDEGVASFDRARPALDSLTGQFPGVPEYAYQLARNYGGLAYIRGRTNKLDQALADNARAAEICDALVKKHPDVPDYAERLAVTYLNIGADRKAEGNYEKALGSVSRALAVAQRLASNNPGVDRYVHIVVTAYNNMGHYQTALGQRDEALSTLTRGIEVAEQLSRENPGVPDYAQVHAFMLFNRGSLQLLQDEIDPALASLRQAHDVFARLSRENPSNHQCSALSARVLEELGWALHARGRDDDAATAFRDCLAIREGLFHDDPAVVETGSSAAWLLADCPLAQLRDVAKASDLARRCLNNEPQGAGSLKALGLARLRSGSAKEAVEALEKAREKLARADQSRPCVELALVMALWQAGDPDAARKLLAETAGHLDKAGLKHPEYVALRAEAEQLLGGGRKRGQK
jgi:serine/threonine-protein kinase